MIDFEPSEDQRMMQDSVAQFAKSTLAPLVQGGGKASAGTATTTVKCPVVNAAKPQSVPVPVTGGI